MTTEKLLESARAFLTDCPRNRVGEGEALTPEAAGLVIYDAPLLKAADAMDEAFALLKSPEAVHPGYLTPGEWLPGAKSVVSFFLPYTEAVCRTNASSPREPSPEWLHARVEGQDVVNLLSIFLRDALIAEGWEALVPALEPRFTMLAKYRSNWSERHTAYICGLGTFGLSKGLITEKGVAGRFGSLITTAPLEVSERPYTELYEYCTRCGACEAACPARAIDACRGEHAAKDHRLCEPFVDLTRTDRPSLDGSVRRRYGCGKCQVGVPCERQRP